MSQNPSLESAELSRAFYSEPDNYAPFDLTKDGRFIIGCVDPRYPVGVPLGAYMVMKQTAGGGAGESLDSALALTAESGDLITGGQALAQDILARPAIVYDAHPGCRFIGGLTSVLAEMEHPSDRTLDNARRWSSELGFLDTFSDNLGHIIVAAAMQAEYVNGQENMEHLVDLVDDAFPTHPNITPMQGQNIARVYTINLDPTAGINKNKIAPSNLDAIQSYHDSLAATFAELTNIRGASPSLLGLRATAHVLRSATVQTVLTAEHLGEVTFLEVRPTAEGRVTEEQF